MPTYSTKASEIRRNWYLVDADGQVMGRLASEVASLIMGKWKPITCPHLDVGDHVVITNAAKVRITGRKLERKPSSLTPATSAADARPCCGTAWRATRPKCCATRCGG